MTDALTRANASISVRGWRSAAVYRRLRYAPCLTLQTPCVALLFILDLHYAEQPYSIPPQKTHTEYGVCFFVPRLCHSVQRAICHCERSVAISRKGNLVINPRGILCIRGEKTHANIRVNIIACDNAISKMLFMTRRCCPGNRGCCLTWGFYETGCGKTASCRRGTICRNFPCLQVARYQGRFLPAMPQSQCRQARR